MPFTPTTFTNGTTPLSAANMNALGTQYTEASNSFQPYLLQPFILSGLACTKDGTTANQLDVTAGVGCLLQTDNTLRQRATSASTTGQFTTSTPSTSYFLDLNADGTFSWGTSHSGAANYLTICTVATDVNGNINTVTDTRATTINFFSGALASGMSINGNAVVTSAGGSLTLTNLTVTTSISFSAAPLVTVTLSGADKKVYEFKATDGQDFAFYHRTGNTVGLYDITNTTWLMQWTNAGTAFSNCIEATGTAAFGGGNYAFIASSGTGAVYFENGNIKSDGSGHLTAGSFIPSISSPTGFNCRGNFSGTGSGTASHGAGQTPAWVGITDSSSGGTMTVGAASYGSSTVVITCGASHTWKGVAL